MCEFFYSVRATGQVTSTHFFINAPNNFPRHTSTHFRLSAFVCLLILASVVVLLSVDRSFHFFVALHVNFFPYLATAIKGVEKELTNLQIKIVIFTAMFHTSFGIKNYSWEATTISCFLFNIKSI